MTDNTERWFSFPAYNSQTIYGYGSPAEAEVYCDMLNRGREINLYTASALEDAERIAALESGEDSGMMLWEEIATDGCLGLDL